MYTYKITPKKTRLFSFSKSGWPCDFLPNKTLVAFGFPYLLIELFYMVCLWCGRTVARSIARSVYGHVITKFSGMGRLPHFLSYGAPPTRALRARVVLRYESLEKINLSLRSFETGNLSTDTPYASIKSFPLPVFRQCMMG